MSEFLAGGITGIAILLGLLLILIGSLTPSTQQRYERCMEDALRWGDAHRAEGCGIVRDILERIE